MKISLPKSFVPWYRPHASETTPLAQALNRLGYYTPHPRHGLTDSRDPDLVQAIRQFKRDFGLGHTGSVYWYDGTVDTLNAVLERKMSGRYIWRSTGDDKTRPSHAARNGRTFSFENPPSGGHPGDDHGCRCWMDLLPSAKESVAKTLQKWRQEQEFLKQEVVGTIVESSKKWMNRDFAFHAYFGRGRSLTLSEIGRLSDIIAVTREKVFVKVEQQVADLMRKQGAGPLVYRTENWYQFGDVKWAFGKSTVKTLTTGQVTRDNDKLNINATVEYSYYDEMTDPSNFRETVHGFHKFGDISELYWDIFPKTIREGFGGLELSVTDAYGSAYIVTGEWQTKMTGYVFIANEKDKIK